MADGTTDKTPKVTLSNWISIIGLIFIAGGMYFQINILQKDVDYLKAQWGPDLEQMEQVLKFEDETLESRLQKKIKIINDLEATTIELKIENIKSATELEIIRKDMEIENLKLEHKINILEIKMKQ